MRSPSVVRAEDRDLSDGRPSSLGEEVWFWVAQRFSAALETVFSLAALAAEVTNSTFSKIFPFTSLATFTLSLAATACGYHTVGHTVALPPNVHTIAIPGFVSQSQTFRIEQRLTDAVVREFNARTQFHVIHEVKNAADADAILKGTVLSTSTTPLAYDSQTGRAASTLVTVSMQVTLTDRQGKVLFQNPSYLFHEQYELSRDLPSFFEEDSPAVDRLSRDFARALVANILEAY
jgi:outer membrane lipopolysaccharide assembly protein LptE/RlpB